MSAPALALSAMAIVVAAPRAGPQSADPGTAPPCRAALADPERFAAALAGLAQYRTTYVLAFVERSDLGDGLASAALPQLVLGVHAGAGAELAREAGLRRLRPYPGSVGGTAQALADLLRGSLDAALLWAPMAGAVLLEGDPDYRVSLLSVGGPRPPPFAVPDSGSAAVPCARAVEDLLAGYGVVDAELMTRVELARLLDRRPPSPGRQEEEEEGRALFARNCAHCHGPEAVADPDSLAPVDLRRSVRRFTYPGFLYIVLNGRPARGHPPFRGKLRESQIERIYQYLRARSTSADAGGGRTVP